MAIEEQNAPKSMYEWLFNPGSIAHRLMHAGFGGIIFATVLKDGLKHLTPSAGGTTIISFVIALLLAWPILTRSDEQRDARMRAPVLFIAAGYVWIALLYFLDVTGLVEQTPKGYDAFTEVIGTLFFVGAWFAWSRYEFARDNQAAERVGLAIVCVLLFMSGAAKVAIQVHPWGNALDSEAARLFVNFCNGAILLSLYFLMRRLFPPPDPVTHTLILLFGCAQIAAYGRDCLTKSPTCAPPTLAGLAALTIAWSLLLGKIAFGLYTSYVFFNGRLGSTPLLSPASELKAPVRKKDLTAHARSERYPRHR